MTQDIVAPGMPCIEYFHSMTKQSDQFQHSYQATVKGIDLNLVTHPDLFSPRRIDAGTLTMLDCVDFVSGDRVLDLGCGCGVVGITAAKIIGEENVFLFDVDAMAVQISKRNAEANALPDLSVTQSDGFRDFRETGFTKILCNPPYHTDFSVARHFILKGFDRLKIGGEMWFVTKRDKWYRNKFAAVFGGVHVIERNSYYVITAEKRRDSYARKA